jgi:hypothetical protein
MEANIDNRSKLLLDMSVDTVYFWLQQYTKYRTYFYFCQFCLPLLKVMKTTDYGIDYLTSPIIVTDN